MSRDFAIVTGAARDQAAHAVTENDQLVHRHRPFAQQRLDQFGESATVARDMQAAVVVQIHRRESGVDGQRRTVIVPVAPPLQIAHAQPVHQQQNLAGRIGNCFRQGAARQFQRLTIAPKLHRDRQRIGAVGKMIAKHAIQRRKHRFALSRRGVATEQRYQPTEQRIDAAADQARDAANGFVYKSRNSLRRLLRGLAENARRAQDIVMHGFDQAGQAKRRIDHEAAGAAKIGCANVGFFGHGLERLSRTPWSRTYDAICNELDASTSAL